MFIDVTCSDGVFCNGDERWSVGWSVGRSVQQLRPTAARWRCVRARARRGRSHRVDNRCRRAARAACDDGDACTRDTCDEQHGVCTYAKLDTPACAESLECGGDKCVPNCDGRVCGYDGCVLHGRRRWGGGEATAAKKPACLLYTSPSPRD